MSSFFRLRLRVTSWLIIRQYMFQRHFIRSQHPINRRIIHIIAIFQRRHLHHTDPFQTHSKHLLDIAQFNDSCNHSTRILHHFSALRRVYMKRQRHQRPLDRSTQDDILHGKVTTAFQLEIIFLLQPPRQQIIARRSRSLITRHIADDIVPQFTHTFTVLVHHNLSGQLQQPSIDIISSILTRIQLICFLALIRHLDIFHHLLRHRWPVCLTRLILHKLHQFHHACTFHALRAREQVIDFAAEPTHILHEYGTHSPFNRTIILQQIRMLEQFGRFCALHFRHDLLLRISLIQQSNRLIVHKRNAVAVHHQHIHDILVSHHMSRVRRR
mmetsp:Transcript_35714/g.57377  ORF Transcript_35714/g.57377 Transcript_35714/m.57377 type:complete len:327 (-) Transcript_35714:41-1021(-)